MRSLDHSRRDFLQDLRRRPARWPRSRTSTRPASDVLRVGLIGCGGRGTGAAAQALAGRPERQARRDGRRLRGPPASRASSTLTERRGRSPPRSMSRRSAASSASTPTSRSSPAASTSSCSARRRTSGRCTSRRRSRPASTSSPRSRSPSTPPASAPSWRPARRRRRRACRSSPASACATTTASARRSGGSTTARSARSSRCRPTTTAAADLGQAASSRTGRDMAWQMRNWYYFTWLSGDFNVEQHVHFLDVCAWVMKDRYPVRAVGMGGRQVAHRAGVRPHLRPLRGRLRVRRRREALQQLPAAAGLQERHERPGAGHEGAGRARRSDARACASGRRRRLDVRRARRTTCTRPSTTSCSPASAAASRSTTASTWPRARCWRSWAGWRPTPARRSPGRWP